MNKPTILIFIDQFLPGFKMGGPITSVLSLTEQLHETFDFKIVTSDRDMGDTIPYPNVEKDRWIQNANAKVFYIKSGFLKPFKIFQLINKTKADIIYLNSLLNPLFSIYIVFLNKIGFVKNKKIVISPRGETYTESLLFKKNKKQIFIQTAKFFNIYKNVYWQASSDVEKDHIIKNLDISEDKITVAQNLTQITKPQLLNPQLNMDEDSALKMVFLARISKDKNIEFTLDILQNIHEKVNFDIYGPIEDEFIWKNCLEKISKLPKNINVCYKGAVDKKDVKKVFYEYDLMFLPSFAENFGHVIVEALSVGTTVLLNNNTPWRDLEKKGFGWDIPLENHFAFEKAINQTAKLNSLEKNQKRTQIQKDFEIYINNPAILEANKNVFLIPLNN